MRQSYQVTFVFLHAFPLGGRMWQSSIDIWPDAFAPTLYGFGDTMTTWAARVLAAAPRGPLTLVGCSMGGSCALEVTRLAPDRVRALVLVGAKAGVRYEPARRDGYIDTLRTRGVDALWEELGPASPPAHEIARDQSIDDLVRGVMAFHTRPDATAVLEAFTRPVHVVRGTDDPIGRKIPFGTFHEVPHAGHFVNLDQPEWFNALLKDLP
jgi:pimeloyl-ACP methyl ester carboxylesterase